MKFKTTLITAASCAAILGSSLVYADSSSAPMVAPQKQQQQHSNFKMHTRTIDADNTIKMLGNVLTGDNALTDKQKEAIKTLADNANKQSAGLIEQLQTTDSTIKQMMSVGIAKIDVEKLKPLMEKKATTMVDVKFVNLQYLSDIHSQVLNSAQSDAVQAAMTKKRSEMMKKTSGEHHTTGFSPQRGGPNNHGY